MALKFTAKIFFDDKKKKPMDLISNENPDIVREKIRDVFTQGYIVLEPDDPMIRAVYLGLEEMDRIELIEEFIPEKEEKKADV